MTAEKGSNTDYLDPNALKTGSVFTIETDQGSVFIVEKCDDGFIIAKDEKPLGKIKAIADIIVVGQEVVFRPVVVDRIYTVKNLRMLVDGVLEKDQSPMDAMY